jgi:hypothetical protein
VDGEIEVSPGDGWDDEHPGDGWDDELGLEPEEQFGSRRDNEEVTLGREDCGIQVSPGDDLKKEGATNIIVKSSEKVSDVSTSSSRQ